MILEAVRPEVEQLLAAHNQEAVDHVVTYITNYVLAHKDSLPPANMLPFSGFCFPHTVRTSPEQQHVRVPQCHAGPKHYGGALEEFRKECRISSPFIALSGEVQYSSWALKLPCLALCLCLCLYASLGAYML